MWGVVRCTAMLKVFFLKKKKKKHSQDKYRFEHLVSSNFREFLRIKLGIYFSKPSDTDYNGRILYLTCRTIIDTYMLQSHLVLKSQPSHPRDHLTELI